MKGFFFNSQPTEDTAAYPGGYDRPYDATDLNRYMGAFFINGVFVHSDADACKVEASGLRLTVRPGTVLVNGGQCHFEPGDGVSLDGPGSYSIMCRMNSAVDVRAFQLVAVKGDGFPAPVRSGDLYDLCLAHVTAGAASAVVTDTRGDRGLCGFASLSGQPPYYPPDSNSLPYILWLYTMGFPMAPEQRAAVEGNPSLMALFRASRTADADAVKRAVFQPSPGAALTALDGTPVSIPAGQVSGMGYVIGSYAGTYSGGSGTAMGTREIRLGFHPKAVILHKAGSIADASGNGYGENWGGALAIVISDNDHWNYQSRSSFSNCIVQITAGGFAITADKAGWAPFNAAGETYHYIAFK